MPKWVYVIIGLSFSTVILSIAYRIFIGDGGRAGIGELIVEVPPARIDFDVDSSNTPPEDSTEIEISQEEDVPSEDPDTFSQSVKTSEVAVALVFDPPSNIRATPNGKIICSVTIL